MPYASGAKGFKSGTFNIVTLYAPGSYVKPEKALTFDLDPSSNPRWRAAAQWCALPHRHPRSARPPSCRWSRRRHHLRERRQGGDLRRGIRHDLSAVHAADPGFVVTANGAYLHSRTPSPQRQRLRSRDRTVQAEPRFSAHHRALTKWSGGWGFAAGRHAVDGQFEIAAMPTGIPALLRCAEHREGGSVRAAGRAPELSPQAVGSAVTLFAHNLAGESTTWRLPERFWRALDAGLPRAVRRAGHWIFDMAPQTRGARGD